VNTSECKSFHESFANIVGALDVRLLDLMLDERPPSEIAEEVLQCLAAAIGCAVDCLRAERDAVVASAASVSRASRGNVHRAIIGYLVLLRVCETSQHHDLYADINGALLERLERRSEHARGRSKQLATKPRRKLLEWDLRYVRLGIALLKRSAIGQQDAMKLHVEFGQFLLTYATRTTAELGVPLEALGRPDATEDTPISPDIDSPEFQESMRLLARGLWLGERSEYPAGELHRLRTFISERLSTGIAMPHRDSSVRQRRLFNTVQVTQTTRDHVLLTLAALELSTLHRQTKRADLAQGVLEFALFEVNRIAPHTEQWRSLMGELASVLSEQGQFEAAEMIQRRLLE